MSVPLNHVSGQDEFVLDFSLAHFVLLTLFLFHKLNKEIDKEICSGANHFERKKTI